MSIRTEIQAAIRANMAVAISEAVHTALQSDEVKVLVNDAIQDVIVEEVKAFINEEDKVMLEDANNSEPAQLALVADKEAPWANATADADVAVEASEDFLKSVGL